jgi:F-type H+-transporting ATPase subunit b
MSMPVATSLLTPDATLIGEIAAFAAVLFVVVRFIVPRVDRAIVKRQETIRSALDSAAAAERRREEVEAECRRMLEEARQRARETTGQAFEIARSVEARSRKAAREEHDRIVSAAEAKAERILSAARAEPAGVGGGGGS